MNSRTSIFALLPSSLLKGSFLFALILGLAFAGCKREPGCTDPNAVNFDPAAEKSDGSCEYENIVEITDNGEGTGTTTWTKDNTYILNGLVYVNAGQTLTIEPGTVIKGRTGQGANAAALLVARGAKIFAVGTESNPIIFTSELDDINDLDDIPVGTRGLWGGLVIMGEARINNLTGEAAIEGISPNEPRGKFGGNNDLDTSGVLKYLSIRHGGIDIGNFSELKGLTLAGVGSGTTVEHIEIFYNKDDGFAFVGGTVDAKYLVAAFCQDDGFDYDMGYRGRCQFLFSLMDPNRGDYGGEHDGGTDPVNGTPLAHPVIYNSTYIGRGADDAWGAVVFKDNSGGEYHNCIFAEYPRGLFVEITTDPDNSYERMLAGELELTGNIFHNIAGNDPDSVFAMLVRSGVTDSVADAALADLIGRFSSWGNQVSNPQFAGITTDPDGTLNPNVSAGVATAGGTAASDSWFDAVSYRGAFFGGNWLQNWTALDDLGFL